MHPMLISAALADQNVRERSRSGGVSDLRRSFAARGSACGPRPDRRGGFRLVLRTLLPRRAS